MLNLCFIAQCLTKSLDSKTHIAPTMNKEHVLINFCQETWAPNEVIPRQITSRPPTQNRGKVIRVDIS